MSGWRDRARCLTSDPELFFPVGTTGPAEQQILDAKSVCALCPVRCECLQWAMNAGAQAQFGVWGGLDEGERRSLRRKLQRPNPKRPDPEPLYDEREYQARKKATA